MFCSLRMTHLNVCLTRVEQFMYPCPGGPILCIRALEDQFYVRDIKGADNVKFLVAGLLHTQNKKTIQCDEC
jgi:hypothetical protein